MGRKNEATKDGFKLKPASRDPSYTRVHGNYPAKKYKKGTPAVTRLSFEFQGDSTQYIDLAQALSAINRKLYRQGCYYYVNRVEMYNNEDAFVDLHVLPDTWVTRAAYRRALGIFNEQNDRAMANTGMVAGKYHDFKVYMSERHFDTGTTPPVLYDINSNYDALASDDWTYSELVSADDDGDATQEADNFSLHMLGGHNGSTDNWDSIGLIKSYEDTRARLPDVSPSINNLGQLQADPLFNLFDYSSEEQVNDVLANLADDADQPPYDLSEMVGNSPRNHQHVGRLVSTDTVGRKDQIGGFCAPLGLIMVDPQQTSTAFRIVVELAEGTYNGVYAERIA